MGLLTRFRPRLFGRKRRQSRRAERYWFIPNERLATPSGAVCGRNRRAWLLFSLALWLVSGADAAAGGRADAARRDELQQCADRLRQPPAQRRYTAARAPLRVLSWNSMKFQRDGAARLLRELAAEVDLQLLQETLRDLASIRDRRWHRYFAEGFHSRRGRSGVSIRSRQRADLWCALRYTEPWLRTPKAVAVARFPLADTRLLVISLHGINFTLSSRAYSAQLASLGALLVAHAGPAIVAGDFNHWNPWRRRAVAEFAARHALQEVAFEPDRRSRHLGAPLDSAFVRGLRVLSATALPSSASDHHPLLITLMPADARRPKHSPQRNPGQRLRAPIPLL